MSVIKGVIVKSSSPSVSDDISKGFYIGFTWLDTSVSPSAVYICASNGVGTAKWENITLTKRCIVNQTNVQNTLGGVIDSSVQYFIDGIVDLTGLGISIEVPSGGINIQGLGLDISKIICSDNNYTMFTSPIGGSGNFLDAQLTYTVSGTLSKLFDLKSVNGFQAIEHNVVNFDDCTSLGVIDNYRQGLESGTGRFGGTPELELRGVWNGYRITTSIVRVLTDGAYSLFKAGVGLAISGRFLTDINVDIPANATFMDFATSNFINPSTLQLSGTIITRNGVTDPNDLNIIPNITNADLISSWKNNIGINNTFVGGQMNVIAEVTTPISAPIGTFYPLLGTYTTSNLEHFDSPSNGQLRHLGNTPRAFNITSVINLEGVANNDVSVKIRKWNNSDGLFEDVITENRQINNFTGGRDIAFFIIITSVYLDQNDYIELQTANNTNNTDLTQEVGSYTVISER
jgi:hypothetical protein